MVSEGTFGYNILLCFEDKLLGVVVSHDTIKTIPRFYSVSITCLKLICYHYFSYRRQELEKH